MTAIEKFDPHVWRFQRDLVRIPDLVDDSGLHGLVFFGLLFGPIPFLPVEWASGVADNYLLAVIWIAAALAITGFGQIWLYDLTRPWRRYHETSYACYEIVLEWRSKNGRESA